MLVHLRASNPEAPLYAVGYSLGSNVLAKFLGEEGRGPGALDGAVCVAAPLDCLSMSNGLSQTFVGRLMCASQKPQNDTLPFISTNTLRARLLLVHYRDPVLVRFVQEVKRSHETMLETHPYIDLAAVSAAKTMAEFDGAAIAPMMGEPSASQYCA
eukprot:SAG11_NODE_298_length_11076_cov_4.253621_11_plen_156_part_00